MRLIGALSARPRHAPETALRYGSAAHTVICAPEVPLNGELRLHNQVGVCANNTCTSTFFPTSSPLARSVSTSRIGPFCDMVRSIYWDHVP